MTLLDMISSYMGTSDVAPIAKGLKGHFINAMLDCDCTDCGSTADYSNCDSPETTHYKTV